MGSIKTAKAHFRRARLLRLPEILQPSFQLLDVVVVNGRFPPCSIQLIRRKSGVVPKGLIVEIQRAIRQSRPGNRRNAIKERAQFQGRRISVLTGSHRANSLGSKRACSCDYRELYDCD